MNVFLWPAEGQGAGRHQLAQGMEPGEFVDDHLDDFMGVHMRKIRRSHPGIVVNEMAPARQPPAAVLCPGLLDDALEVGSRDEREYLAKHAA